MGPQESKILNLFLKSKLNGYKLSALSSFAAHFSRGEEQESPQFSGEADIPFIF